VRRCRIGVNSTAAKSNLFKILMMPQEFLEILDLSKVEAGRYGVGAGDVRSSLAIDNARTFVRERATKHGITLDVAVDERLSEFFGVFKN
jgi:hypothetical protein